MPLITTDPLINTQGTLPIRAIHPKEVIEASAYVPVLEPDDSVDSLQQMRRVKDELATTGNSVEAERALLNAVTEQNAASLDALNDFVLSPDSTPDTILAASEGLRRVISDPVDMATAFAKKNATVDLSETAEELATQDQNVEFFKEIVENEREMAKLDQFNPYARNDIASRVGYTFDGASVVIPFNFQSGIRDIKESLGLESSMWDFIFFGSAMDDVKRHLEAMPEIQRVEAMRELHGLLQNQGFTGTNEFIGSALTEELLINPQGNSTQETINNIIGVLDLVGVGQGLKGMFGGFKRLVTPIAGKPIVKKQLVASIQQALGTETSSAVLPRVAHASPMKIATKTNPRASRNDVAAIIADDSGQVAAEMGLSRDVAINEWVLPKSHIEASPITAQPGNVSVEVLRIRNQLQSSLADIKTNVLINFTEEELKSSGVEALKRLGKLFNSKTNVPSSVVKFTDEGVEFAARFQANDVGGWTSVRKLNQQIDTLFGKEGGALKGLKIHRKNPESGQWVDISKQLGLKQNQQAGEFSFTIDMRLDADPAIKQAFGDDAISAGLGRFTKYATNPHAIFSKKIVDGAVLAKDKSAKLQHRMLNILTDNFTVLRKGAPQDFPLVLDAIRRGAKEEVWFDRTALRAKFGIESEKGLQAYEVFKEIQDTLFHTTSGIQYRVLKKEGYSSIYLNNSYSGFNVKAVEGGSDTLIGKSVYVPSTDRVLKISNKDTLDKLIEDGVQFGTLKSPFRVGDNEFQFAAILPKEGAKTDLLAHYPVPYRQGHYTRFYDDGNWVVKVKNNPRRHVNGKKEPGGSETLGVARNRTEAETIMARFEEEELASLEGRGLEAADAKTFEVITGDLWHTGKATTEADWDLISRSMLNTNRRRGEHLRGIEDLASIDDPLESTAKQIGAVMDKATKQEWIDSQQNAWVKTFSKAFFEDSPSLVGKWPDSTADLVKQVRSVVSKKPHLDAQGKRAIAHYEYVEMIRGLPNQFDEWWKVWNMKMSENLGGVGTKQFQWAAKKKPLEALRSTAFKILLGLNPLKHLQLQPSQILQLSFVEPTYIYNFGKGGLVREFYDLASYSSGRAIGVDVGEHVPKGKELWDEFSRTGLSEAVAHHVFLNPGDTAKRLKPGILEPGALPAARRATSTAINAPQKVGFETGERANVMLHWLVARKRWIDRNPGKDWKADLARDQIHAEQRAISLNPNPAGKLAYQDWGTAWGGVSALLFQFFTHGHKTVTSVLPRKLGGSKVFTASEKAKIAGANVTLFGAAAIPFMNDFMDSLATQAQWDIDPEVWKDIKHGFTDVAFNRLLSVLSGEEQDIRFSSTFNPTTGIQAAFDNIYKFIMNDADYKPDLFASAAVVSSMFETVGAISTVWSQPDTMSDDKLTQSIMRITELAPGWSAYIKGKIALNTGILVSKNGRQIAPATSLEAVAKMMGWTIGAEEDYYDNLEKMSRVVFEGSEKEIRDSARDMLKDYMSIYKTDDRPIIETVLQLMSDASIIHRDLRARSIFMEEVSRLTEKSLKTGEQNLLTIAIEAAMKGDREELLNLIRNSEGLPEEARNAFELALGVRK